MKDTQAAFFWILEILERHRIVYRIYGGLASRIYGAERELADIDIAIPTADIKIISAEVSPYIIFGPGRYTDENWDLELMTLEYAGQEIDLASVDAKIFNQQTQAWESYGGNLETFTLKEIYGKLIPLEPLESLIMNKRRLAREVDLEDVRQLTQRGEREII